MEKTFTGNKTLKQVIQKTEAERQAKAERIAKRKRVIFVRRLVAVSLLLMAMFTTVSFANNIYESGKEKFTTHVTEETAKEIKKYEQVEVTINRGETAWDIQSKLTPDKDVRDMLFLVEKINNRFTMENIRSGETIIFLTEKGQK